MDEKPKQTLEHVSKFRDKRRKGDVSIGNLMLDRPLYTKRNASLILSDHVHVYCGDQEGDFPVPSVVGDFRKQIQHLDANTPNDDDFLMSCCEITWKLSDRLSSITEWMIISYSWIHVAMILSERSSKLTHPYISSCRHGFDKSSYFACPIDDLEASKIIQIEPRVTITTYKELRSTLEKLTPMSAT